ncbi:nucleolar protein 10-like [Mercenaria mercenaria]|uniref:nucleolar protein 10-like n=1 Tax=Mercenaria mercenaria TaxID=6596 RepID=UPI00234F525F|nr:nucleolar protein 10-like [Mercenaria mercenaria]
MQVSNPNNVKIYNLSAGKSLPEWLSDRKKRTLQKQDVDIQRRVELIQDFDMPTVSHCVQVSPDGQYIYVAGTYKPRVRCYDVQQMSMKFERGLDSDVVQFQFLSEDYTKIAFLQCDRYIEFHSQFGRYYRTRIPKYGRDLAYYNANCDLYVAGVSPEVYRINLEQGRFLSPVGTEAQEVRCCEFNDFQHLLACGTTEGHVECFDPRVRTRVGILDTALSSHIEDLDIKGVPAITALKYRGPLQLAVGTSTGHVLLYDIRSDKPLIVKDHQYELPIKKIMFHDHLDLVMSMDTKILKLWDRNTGKAYTAIEPGVNLNDLCMVPGSGLVFMANEGQKVLTYYLPSLGTAPRWCSFLDSLTEELEESNAAIVYDDYKFVTRKELEDLGLNHLIGSNLLRAYMHGFFLDIRLYHKAKSLAEPFAYEEYRKNKIREKIEAERANRVTVKKLPKVNKELAEKLLDVEDSIMEKKTAKRAGLTLLKDDRFSQMFKNPDFQIDKESEEYKLLNPVVSKLDKAKKKKQQKLESQFEEIEDDGLIERGGYSDSSSDDEHTWTVEDKLKWKKHVDEQKQSMRAEKMEKAPKFFALKEGVEFGKSSDEKRIRKEKKLSLAERLAGGDDVTIVNEPGAIGNKELKFTMKKGKKELRQENEQREHNAERRKIRRSAGEITKGLKQKPKFWMGQRVK